jgi:hypothetical protein
MYLTSNGRYVNFHICLFLMTFLMTTDQADVEKDDDIP